MQNLISYYSVRENSIEKNNGSSIIEKGSLFPTVHFSETFQVQGRMFLLEVKNNSQNKAVGFLRMRIVLNLFVLTNLKLRYMEMNPG